MGNAGRFQGIQKSGEPGTTGRVGRMALDHADAFMAQSKQIGGHLPRSFYIVGGLAGTSFKRHGRGNARKRKIVSAQLAEDLRMIGCGRSQDNTVERGSPQDAHYLSCRFIDRLYRQYQQTVFFTMQAVKRAALQFHHIVGTGILVNQTKQVRSPPDQAPRHYIGMIIKFFCGF